MLISILFYLCEIQIKMEVQDKTSSHEFPDSYDLFLKMFTNSSFTSTSAPSDALLKYQKIQRVILD